MAKIKPMALIESMSGKVCMHSDTYFRANKRNGNVYTGKLCNPRTKPYSASEVARQNLFSSAVASAKLIAAATATDTANFTKKNTYTAAYNANPDFGGTLFNYFVKREYAVLQEAED